MTVMMRRKVATGRKYGDDIARKKGVLGRARWEYIPGWMSFVMKARVCASGEVEKKEAVLGGLEENK